MTSRERAGQIVIHGAFALLFVLVLYPFFMTLSISVKDELQFIYNRFGPSFPLWFWTYRRAAVAVIGYLVNTTVNGVVTIVAVLVLSSFTGYIFARLKFPGKEILFYMIFSLLMIPSILTLVPQFMIVKGLGLLNTRWVLILPWTAIHQVLGIFLMRTYLEGLPGDLFESARIDGCGDFRTYWHIVLPLSKPILATLAVMKLVDIWNDLIWPSVTITDYSKQVLSVGIWALTTEFSGQYGPMFAGYVFGSLPLILVFMFGSKYYVEGLLSGALKF